jgi:hypothetical protein
MAMAIFESTKLLVLDHRLTCVISGLALLRRMQKAGVPLSCENSPVERDRSPPERIPLYRAHVAGRLSAEATAPPRTPALWLLADPLAGDGDH